MATRDETRLSGSIHRARPTTGTLIIRGEITGAIRRRLKEQEIAWAWSSAIAEEERLALARLHRGEGLPLYRVILDLHSGKFFGTAGVVVYDLAAVSVVLLSATGLWLAVRNFYRSGRSNRRE